MSEKQFEEFIISKKKIIHFFLPSQGNSGNSAAFFPLTRPARKESGGNAWDEEALQVGGVQLHAYPKKKHTSMLKR